MAEGFVMSRRFLIACWAELKPIWPILSGLAGAQVVLGALVGLRENWSFGESIYFSLITGLTIGYGDLVPLHFMTRFLSVLIGFVGILTTGLVAAVSVRALQAVTPEAPPPVSMSDPDQDIQIAQVQSSSVATDTLDTIGYQG
jgi:hypothetical protein